MDYQTKKAVNRAKAAYMREWRKKNPDKVREARERYWTKRAMKLMEAEKLAQDQHGNAVSLEG